jgi:hypothetical protein
MAMTVAQKKAVAIAPKFTAAASAIGSLTICYLILRKPTKRKTYHRLLLGMSICDFSASVAWFFTTWPIPLGTPGVFGAVGTQQTCTAQAFFAQFSLSTVMYNACLAVYYFLVIVKGWRDDDIVKIEPFFHAFSIAWGLGTAVASLFLTLFNQVGWDCWIGGYPLGCKESWNNNGVTTCTRGDNGSLYKWAFYYAPLWLMITLVTALMCLVYWTVREQERTMHKYQPRASVDAAIVAEIKESNSRKIAKQAAYYVGAFYAAWFFPTIFQLVLVTSGKVHFVLLFLAAVFVPIQGLLNLIVYLRPKYIHYRENCPEQFFFFAWTRLLWDQLCFRNDARHDSTSEFVPRITFRNSLLQQVAEEEKMEEVAESACAQRVNLSSHDSLGNHVSVDNNL